MYNYIFARHRLDIVRNADFKVELTPRHEEIVYSQSVPQGYSNKSEGRFACRISSNTRVRNYNYFSSSQIFSPDFVQRKPNGKLRISVDLRGINHLIKNDYGEHNHLVTTIADAAQHMAGKNTFAKLIVFRLTIANQCLMSNRSNFCRIILVLELLHFYV